jgi:hypothetical protein
MQPAVSSPSRGTLAAALLLSVALFVPAEQALSSTVVVDERAATVDDGWQHANYLAWAIKHRRYGDIDAVAAQIDASSPYARWVPAAIGLAIEQLDATAGAYAQMGRCRELGAFRRRIASEWPAGQAAMRARSCGSFVCGTGKAEMIEALGGVAAYRSVQQVLRAERFTEHVLEIDRAIAAGDHAAALELRRHRHDGPMPAMPTGVPRRRARDRRGAAAASATTTRARAPTRASRWQRHRLRKGVARASRRPRASCIPTHRRCST